MSSLLEVDSHACPDLVFIAALIDAILYLSNRARIPSPSMLCMDVGNSFKAKIYRLRGRGV